MCYYYFRYKRRKKHKKSSKKRDHFLSSESDLNVENTDTETDDDLPLSAFTTKKKHAKKLKKRDRNYMVSKHGSHSSLSSPALDLSKNGPDRVPQVDRQENPNMPSCSRYSSDSSPSFQRLANNHSDRERERGQSEENGQNHEDSSGSVNLPTCSKYAYSPYTSSQDGTNSSNLNMVRSDGDTSNEGYPLKHLVKSEVREVRPEERNERLRNLLIKKEGSSNMWYSYPCNYNTDSSEN